MADTKYLTHRPSSIHGLDVRLGESLDDAVEGDATHRAARLLLAPIVDAFHAEHVVLENEKREKHNGGKFNN